MKVQEREGEIYVNAARSIYDDIYSPLKRAKPPSIRPKHVNDDTLHVTITDSLIDDADLSADGPAAITEALREPALEFGEVVLAVHANAQVAANELVHAAGAA